MDSRTKIVPFSIAQDIAANGATLVSGYFDPLVASHAERLRSLKREGTSLVVLIADPEDPILPARARMELVAGLALVDYVTEAHRELTPHVRLEEEHTNRLEELIAHVHARQRTAS